jgi:hypothetical protein
MTSATKSYIASRLKNVMATSKNNNNITNETMTQVVVVFYIKT